MRSTRFVEQHFDAKATRWQSALRSAPNARNFEVLPLLIGLRALCERRPEELVLADLLCGSGFLTSKLSGIFKHSYGIDISQRMLEFYPVGPHTSRIKASIADQPNILSDLVKPDVMVSLAGLHHIYETDGTVINEDESLALQRSVVLSWARSLQPGGVLVLADITDPEVDSPLYAGPRAEDRVSGTLARRYGDLLSPFSGHFDAEFFDRLVNCGSLKDYSSWLRLKVNLKNVNPGTWFRNIVNQYGLFGHEDYFLKPDLICKSLKAEGFSVSFREIPAPWIFDSKAAFLYFFYEKFAFGPRINEFSEIPESISNIICESAEQYLGLCSLPNGGLMVGWRLGYYFVCRPPDE